jgi:tetratricopeptide (TPR) repeat protein
MIPACSALLILALRVGGFGIQGPPVSGVSEIDGLRREVDLAPEDSARRRALGAAYFREGRIRDAIGQFEAAIALTPIEESSHLLLTDLYWMMGLTAEAEAAAVRAVELMPESQRARQTLADLYANSGRPRRSLDEYQRAIGLAGPVPREDLLRKLGDAYAVLARFDEAESVYLEALAIDPEAIAARMGLGNAYLRSGRFAEAAGQYGRVSRAHADHLASRVRLAEVYLRLGRLDESVDASSEALGLDPVERGALYLRGTALLGLGQSARGEADLEAFRRLEEAASEAEHRELEVIAFNREAVALVRQERYQEAVEVLVRGIDARPDARSLYLNLGLVQSQAGDHRGAAETFSTMLRLGFSDDPAVHQNLVREYELLGDMDASRAHRAILRERFGLSP